MACEQKVSVDYVSSQNTIFKVTKYINSPDSDDDEVEE